MVKLGWGWAGGRGGSRMTSGPESVEARLDPKDSRPPLTLMSFVTTSVAGRADRQVIDKDFQSVSSSTSATKNTGKLWETADLDVQQKGWSLG